jgi:hypothetical protein
MFTSNIGLVSQSKSVTLSQLSKAAAAIQKQITRDFRPLWQIDATVDAFDRLGDVPLGYWQVVIRDTITFNAQGIHLNKANGQPYALVKHSKEWTLTTSHECLEMLADPSGNRVIASNSVKPDQGRVEYLVEVCDPSEAAALAYSVNGVLVSDFYTPNFFDPVPATAVRYSYTGALTAPRQVLEGGYLSWREPISGHLWQLFVVDGDTEFVDQGPISPDWTSSLRHLSDMAAETYRAKMARPNAMAGAPRRGLLLAASGAPHQGDPEEAAEAAARQLQDQIDLLS